MLRSAVHYHYSITENEKIKWSLVAGGILGDPGALSRVGINGREGQSETSIQMGHGTGSLRVTSRGLARPLLETFVRPMSRWSLTKGSRCRDLTVLLLIYLLFVGIKYHAFIAYSNEDKPWAEKIIKLLEGKHHLKCCIHYRDFPVGRDFRDNMADSVYQSFKVIALFSKNFVNSDHCPYELNVAIGRQVENRDRSLVVIRIDGVDFKHLPSELRERSLIDYNDILQRPLWKKNLLEFLKSPLQAESHSDNAENGSDTTARVNTTTGDNSDSPLIV